MAFGSRGIDPVIKSIELDSLADWLFEQLSDSTSPIVSLWQIKRTHPVSDSDL